MTVTLKLKTTDFKSRTRATSLHDPTQLAHLIFAAAQPLLKKEATGTKFRLIGVGISHLTDTPEGEDGPALDARYQALTKAELAIDKLRRKFGDAAVEKGRSLGRNDD